MKIFEDRIQASQAAAELIAATLSERLLKADSASLVVSGGSTPVETLKILSQTALDWQRVEVTLTDERNVPVDHNDSNEAMVRKVLLQDAAESAGFLKPGKDDLTPLLPFSCTLVGMGEDGHFASLFPDSPQLNEGLDSTCATIQVETPSSPHGRTSMTLECISRSKLIILLIFGEAKRKIVEAPHGYPVSHLLKRTTPLIIWAP